MLFKKKITSLIVAIGIVFAVGASVSAVNFHWTDLPVLSTATDNYRPLTKVIQRNLEVRGYKPGSIDGYFGNNTRDAVMKFQADHSYFTGGADGKVGINTWKTLKEYGTKPLKQSGSSWEGITFFYQGDRDNLYYYDWGNLSWYLANSSKGPVTPYASSFRSYYGWVA